MHWLEGALDEYHDDVLDELDVDGLQKLLDGWTAEQSVSSFVVDYDRVVVLTASSCWACGADGDPLNEDGRCPACAAPEQGA
jgi:predicted Zn-ribbon and HTH transcriptional regulator